MNPNSKIQEYNLSDKRLSNHQRLKDREMQRAFDAGVEVPFLPTESRARRAGTTQHKIIETYKKNMEINNHASSVPVLGS